MSRECMVSFLPYDALSVLWLPGWLHGLPLCDFDASIKAILKLWCLKFFQKIKQFRGGHDPCDPLPIWDCACFIEMVKKIREHVNETWSVLMNPSRLVSLDKKSAPLKFPLTNSYLHCRLIGCFNPPTVMT